MDLNMGLDNEVVQWGVLAVIIGFGLFINFKAFMKLKNFLKAKKEYLAKSKDTVEQHQDYIKWCLIYVVVGAFGAFGLVSQVYVKQDIFMIAAYIFLFLYLVAFMFEVVVRRSIIFDEHGWFYEGIQYRYKSIVSIERVKGFIPNYQVRLTTQSQTVLLPKKYGVMLEEKAEQKKKKKKMK